jgi:hypothetical protein
MNTHQDARPTRSRSVAFNAIRPRRLVFIGIAVAVIVLQLLAMDWVVSVQVDRARVREAEHMSQAAAGPQPAGPAAAATAGISSDAAQSPPGVSTVSYSPER